LRAGRLQVNYGLMTTRQGCPICVSVYAGNTAATKTLMPQVSKLKEIEGMAWLTALKSGQIRDLIEAGALQLGLFDEHNLFEFSESRPRLHRRQYAAAQTDAQRHDNGHGGKMQCQVDHCDIEGMKELQHEGRRGSHP